MTDKLLPCPFCGGEADPKGWMDGNGEQGPECEQCGATAGSIAAWNTRAAPRQPEGELEVVAWRHCADRTKLLCNLGKQRAIPGDYADEFTIPLCSMPDAQRAIAELREECERLHDVVALKEQDTKEAQQAASSWKAERDTLRQQLDVITKDRDDCLEARLHYVGKYGDALAQRDKLAGLLREVLDADERPHAESSELNIRARAALAEVNKP